MLERLFLCVGAQKAGTTWLNAVLSKDERFGHSPFTKEVHYFDGIYEGNKLLNRWRADQLLRVVRKNDEKIKPALAAWLGGQKVGLGKILAASGAEHPHAVGRKLEFLLNEVNDDWYVQLLQCGPGQEWSMDMTPCYAVIGSEGFAHCKRLANELKLVFILRNPVERAWSGLLENKKRAPGGIDGYLSQKLSDVDALFEECTRPGAISARTNYVSTLSSIREAELSDNLLVKFYDDISTNPKGFVSDVYSHLGMSPDPACMDDRVLGARVYGTQKTERPKQLEIRLRDYYRPMVLDLQKFNIDVPKAWLEYFGI